MMKDKLYISKATRVHYEDPLALPSSILFKVFLFLKHEDHVSAMCAFADFRSTSFHAKAISCAFRPGYLADCSGCFSLQKPTRTGRFTPHTSRNSCSPNGPKGTVGSSHFETYPPKPRFRDRHLRFDAVPKTGSG